MHLFFSLVRRSKRSLGILASFFTRMMYHMGNTQVSQKKVEKLSWRGKEVMKVSIIWLTNKDKDWLTWQTNIQRLTDRHSLSVSFCNTVISDKRTVFYPGYNIIVNGYNQCTKNIRIYSKILLWILIFILVILKAEYYLKIGIFLYKYFQKLSLEFELNMSCGWGVVVHRNGPGVETPRCPITMD